MGRRDTSLSLTDASAWRGLGLLPTSASGITVNEETALNYSAVFRAVDLLSDHFAMLPLQIFQQIDDRTKQKATKHRLYNTLHLSPNPIMHSMAWRKLVMAHRLLWGNHYSEIEFLPGNRINLWPLTPSKMEKIERRGYELIYHYRNDVNRVDQIPSWAIFHYRGLSTNGYYGISILQKARQSIGLGLATEEFGARFFGNDARPGGVLQHPGVLDDDAYKRLLESWESRHGGLSKSHKTAILEEGMTYQQIGIPPEDAQFLETRKFQVTEVARWFGVPPHKLYDLERATFSNIEHQGIEYTSDSLQPHITNFELTCDTQLMTEAEQARFYTKINMSALLRGDTQARHEAYGNGLQNGYYSINDVRNFEDENPIDGGDDYRVPLNMIPVTQADMLAQPQPAQEPPQRAKRENRAKDSGAARHSLRNDMLPVYQDVMGRLLRREANDVGNNAKRLANGDFMTWLDAFYEEHKAVVVKELRSITQAYGNQVVKIASDEVEADAPQQYRTDAFIAAYLQTFAVRHVAKQSARVQGAVASAATPEEQQAAVNEEMDSWRNGPRADGIAGDEATRLNNAAAIFAYTAAGVVRKQWLSFGDSCPYCTNLNGQTVGIEVNFLAAGQSFNPEGAPSPLIPSYNVGHAPAHDGCDCMVISA